MLDLAVTMDLQSFETMINVNLASAVTQTDEKNVRHWFKSPGMRS